MLPIYTRVGAATMITEWNKRPSGAAVEARCAHISARVPRTVAICNTGLHVFTLFLRDRADMILAHLALLGSCTGPFVLTGSRGLGVDFPMEHLKYLHKLE